MSELVKVSGVHRDVAERLRHLYVAHDGDLRERDVLADAVDEASPLHAYFEWDDSEAAAAFRLNQAAALIRRVKVEVIHVPDGPPIKVRAYVARSELSATAETGEPGSYVAIEHVAGQTAWEASMRDSMQRDLLRLKRRYDNTSLLFDVAAEVFGA
jgi:hypothetical protein